MDTIYTLSCYIINFNNTPKMRWFMLHTLVNCIVVYYSLPDIHTCVNNIDTCFSYNWNNNSIKVYNYATVLHIYHCIFFKLTADDILHHFSMVGICGTLCYLLQSIISSLALFFLSGLPGAIDYMLLYLVKINYITSLQEKKIYSLISCYIRSPGCIYTVINGMYGVVYYYNHYMYYKMLMLLLTISLIFWNGQYYLLSCHESYVKNKYIRYFT